MKGRGVLTEADVKEAMREVKMALLEADVSYKVVKDFIGKVTERAVGTDVLASLTPAQQVIKIVNEELIALMGNENARINYPSKPPCIIMMVGLQGSGKTTHAAKACQVFQAIRASVHCLQPATFTVPQLSISCRLWEKRLE
ncbi:MAG: signal recognition particle receptor subunit alpha [Ruminococcus sp.]|nr:MAG: signal recognition particle receptor subunit alpha [Ruminococcus sp.]